MKSVNSLMPAANPATPNQRIDDSSKRLSLYQNIRVACKHLDEDALETDPTLLGIVAAMKVAARQMMLLAPPEQVLTELQQHLASIGGAGGAMGLGVPGAPGAPGQVTAGPPQGGAPNPMPVPAA